MLLLVVAALGLLAGVLVAGRPQAVPSDVQAIEIPPSTSTTTTSTLPTTATSTTTTALAPTTTTLPATTSSTTAVPESPADTTEHASNTSEVAATEEPVATEEPTTTTTSLVPERSVVVVVANASDTFGLATRSADQIREFGYEFVVNTDGLGELPDTAIYFAEGYELEARRLADQIGAPRRLVAPRPTEPLHEGEIESEVLLMLGNDWREVTELDAG